MAKDLLNNSASGLRGTSELQVQRSDKRDLYWRILSCPKEAKHTFDTVRNSFFYFAKTAIISLFCCIAYVQIRTLRFHRILSKDGTFIKDFKLLTFLLVFVFVADCPAGSFSTPINRTCILCPRGTYQPSRGRLSCLPCGQNLTTTSAGTVDKIQCFSRFKCILLAFFKWISFFLFF